MPRHIFSKRIRSADIFTRPKTCPAFSWPRTRVLPGATGSSSSSFHRRNATPGRSTTAQPDAVATITTSLGPLKCCTSALLACASPPTPKGTTHKPSHAFLRRFSSTASLAKKSRRRKPKASPIPIEQDGGTGGSEHLPKSLSLGDGLSDEQRAVLDLVLSQRENVFFTGPAGTGKSFLLHKIIEGLTIKYIEDGPWSVAVTASTGLAAYNIRGTTLHRFAGIGLGKAPTTKLIMDIFKSKLKLRRWMKVKALVIDEVSMVDATLFDKLDLIARAVRGIDKAFGGIQLVITGDFFQLPPVVQGPEHGGPRFCFEAEAWKSAIKHTISLTKIYRQRDPIFASMLNEIREGILSPSTIGTFRRLSRPLQSKAENGPEAAELFPLRHEADAANARRMQKIKSAPHTYLAKEGGIIEDADTRKKLLSDCMAPEVLQIKKGAQVMLIKNIDNTLVNGSVGRVVGFANKQTFFHDRWEDEEQGEGQEWHLGTIPTAVDTLPEHRLPLYPVVRFKLAKGGTRTELCEPMEWTVERWVPEPWSDDGWTVEKLATRTQIPLILAWSLSIHKSQGQTLELVKVDLDRVFETGQAYVALSRATSMDGLQVLNFDPNKVAVHPRVKAFYASLSGILAK